MAGQGTLWQGMARLGEAWQGKARLKARGIFPRAFVFLEIIDLSLQESLSYLFY